MRSPYALGMETVNQPMADIDWAAMKQRFQQFTAPTTVSEILRSCLPELSSGARHMSACTVQDARLKTFIKTSSKIKSTLSACYQLILREPSMSECSQYLVYLKAYLDGRSVEAFRSLTRNLSPDPEWAQAAIHVPEHEAIIWRFPHDPGLPHLPQLIDLQTVTQHLPLEGLRQIGIAGTPQVMARHIVNYRPEIRCTNRYDLYDLCLDQTYQLFGKTFCHKEGQSLHTRLQYFWERSLCDSDAMRVAQPLGYSGSVNTVWQRGVPGTPLIEVLNPSNHEHYITALAQGLVSLHTSQVPGLTIHSTEDHVTEAHKKLAKLSDALPALTKTCMALADDLEQTTPLTSAIPACPIHWDFHIQQLLAHEGRLVFCDLDELVIGDPIQDLANFIVDLHFRGLDRHMVRRISTALYHTYRRRVEWEVPITQLTWHVRLQLLNKAYRHYLRFAPGFERTVEQILRLAQRGFSL